MRGEFTFPASVDFLMLVRKSGFPFALQPGRFSPHRGWRKADKRGSIGGCPRYVTATLLVAPKGDF